MTLRRLTSALRQTETPNDHPRADDGRCPDCGETAINVQGLLDCPRCGFQGRPSTRTTLLPIPLTTVRRPDPRR